MSMSDPIADMLTRVRNGLHRQHPSVSMPHSRVKEAIAQVLKEEGYVEDFSVLSQEPRDVLQIDLKYVGGRRDRRSVITGIERVSKPGRRIYVDKNRYSLGVERHGYCRGDDIARDYDWPEGSSSR